MTPSSMLSLLFLIGSVSAYAVNAATKSEQLASYYEEADLNEYKSFSDFYLVMKRYGFPNLFSETHDSLIAPSSFSNPKTLKEFKKIKAEKASKELKLDRQENNGFKPKSKAERLRSEKAIAERYHKIGSFKKSGFYDYFSSKLENQTVVRICINADKHELGAVTTSDQYVSQKLRREIVSRAMSEILNDLQDSNLLEPYAPERLASEDCDLIVSVNNSQLKQLNKDERVHSFLSPDLVEIRTFNLN